MRFGRTAGRLALIALLAVLLIACSAPRPSADPAPADNPPPASGREPEVDPRHNPPKTPATPPPTPGRPAEPKPKPASVKLEQLGNEGWRTVTVLDSHTMPGSAILRLTFSKPVVQAEVEQALKEAQAGPVRGVMQWLDEQTLLWHIAALPARLDVLLGLAHDQDGLSLPGGIPSLRVGDPPTLVRLDLASGAETPVATLPPDIESAGLSPDGTHLNLVVWRPGSTPWDWQPGQLAVELATGELRSGWVEGPQPRLTVGLEQWALNPAGTVVAGIRGTDLMLMDMRGGRQQVVPGFVARTPGQAGGEALSHLAWSPGGEQVAALSPKGNGLSDLVGAVLPAGPATVLAADLPIPAGGTHLAWSPDGRFLLAGHLLIDLQDGSYRPIEGVTDRAAGAWEPGATRALLGGGDWGLVWLVDPAANTLLTLGEGLATGWAGPGQVYLVRWPASNTRYVPPGQQIP